LPINYRTVQRLKLQIHRSKRIILLK
jgi:hypothetical protein